MSIFEDGLKSVRKAVETDNVDPNTYEAVINQSQEWKAENLGADGGHNALDVFPMYDALPGDVIIPGNKNSRIVLLGDRQNVAAASGYAGAGHTGCGALLLTAGAMGGYARSRDPKTGKPIAVGPDYKLDAATIYLSQKTDVDKYFDLCDGMVGHCVKTSAIAIKADEVRLVARGGIKLVTGTDMRDSQADLSGRVKGIELISGNDDSNLQPLVLGDNLVECLDSLHKKILGLKGLLHSHVKNQREINIALMTHTHISGWQIPGTPVVSSMLPIQLAMTTVRSVMRDISDTEVGIASFGAKMKLWKNNYLEFSNEGYLLSTRNRTN